MPYYIYSESRGLYIGQLMGICYFIAHVLEGILPVHCARPVIFDNQEEAQKFLNSWSAGKDDCEVKEIPDDEIIPLVKGIEYIANFQIRETRA